MKYVITGSAGHISKPLALQLLAAGHQVTVIGRNAENLKDLIADSAIGSVEDVAFLTTTFTGADAVYTMVPPSHNSENWKAHIALIGKNYADAIEAAGVQYVVNLSSIGAHMPTGCGPVSGLHFVEKHLNNIEGIHVKHLRPAYFYYNYFSNIAMIKGMGIIGSNYGNNTLLPMAATEDIAAKAAAELLALNFTGKSETYIISDEKKAFEIANILGKAINIPTLPWVEFSDEQLLAGLLQAGLNTEMASNYVEMGTAIRTGKMMEDFELRRDTTPKSNTAFEQFAVQFAAAYHQ